MSLNDLNTEFSSEIAAAADDLSNSLPLSKPTLRAAFSDDELKQLQTMISDVNRATDDNQKIVAFAAHAKSAFKLLKVLGVAL
jgi:hypothetical protein